MDLAMGMITPLSFIPHPVLPYTDEMTFVERVYNVFLSAYDALLWRFNYMPAQNKLALKYFRDGIEGEIPHVIRMEKNIAVMLVNAHPSLNIPRPKMPGQVDIAGAHIRSPFLIPNDQKVSERNFNFVIKFNFFLIIFQLFFDGAEHGVIIFSLGTYLKTNEMPKEKLTEIIEAFRDIKQRVLWKVDEDIPGTLPPNVMTQKWIPQSDALAHPKVVLFISHGEVLLKIVSEILSKLKILIGGLFGVQEALFRKIPMLVIPFFNDQQRLGAKAQKDGYGLVLQFDHLTKETLIASINELTTDPNFKVQVEAASALFKDNAVSPMNEAMFWVEHAIRTKGAKHLKSTSVDLCWCKYLLLDVISFYFGIFALSFLSWVLIIKLCIKRYRAKEHKGKFKYY